MKQVLSVIFLSLVAFVVVISVSVSSEIINVYGYDVSVESPSIGFVGNELDDIASITDNLKKFKHLEAVSLGDFPVNVTDEAALSETFPDVDFKLNTYAVIYGTPYFATATSLDFTGRHIEDITELYENLSYLPHVYEVTFNPEDSIPAEDKARLCEKYPYCKFDVCGSYEVFGTRFREDVTLLDLRGLPVEYDLLAEKISQFSNLYLVDLTGVNLTYEQKIEIKNAFPGVIFEWEVELFDKTYDSQLKVLDLEGENLVGRLDEIRRAIPLFHKLTKVDMSDCGIGNEEMAAFREEITDTKIVWRVDLGVQWSLKTDQVNFSVLIYLYGYQTMTTADIQVLKYCNELQSLDLGHQSISDISVLGDYCKELRILILADNNLTDLSPLAKLPHLHYLEFFVNNVTDLTPLASCKELVDLNISYNHNLSDITPLLNLPKLERLWLESCPVSAADVQKLRDTYPYATIVNVGSGSVDMGWRSHDRYWAMYSMFVFDQYNMDPEFSKYD